MAYPTIGGIVRENPGLDRLIDPNARIEVLASGFRWAEGPVWMPEDACVLFSDIPNNVIHRWKEGEGLSVFMKPSGYTGVVDYQPEPGSNGLTRDLQGRLVLMEHGDRRVARLEKDGGKKTLVDSFQGKRLNSPNDGCFRSNGDLYFTDPPYGLPGNWDDPRRELDFCGVFRLAADGALHLVTREMTRPNGICFSPDETTLYVANSDSARALWMAFPVRDDGSVGPGRVFADVTSMVPHHPGAPDGLKADVEGNLWAAAPGGIHVMTPGGQRLGRIDTTERVANCAWGDDGSTLYITSHMHLCRVRARVQGIGCRG